MDATRRRRTTDAHRQRWYARWRCVRFARHLGFAARPLVAAVRVVASNPAPKHL
jgi:hypothetical protein